MKTLLTTLLTIASAAAALGQEADTKQSSSVYDKAYKAAMADSVISAEEQVLLDILSTQTASPSSQKYDPNTGEPLDDKESDKTLKFDPATGNQIQASPPTSQLDQSGRWPLVLQNIALGAGLYGWAVPYVLNADDFRWYTGGVMVSAGSAFYLTYQYTKGVEMTHARTQMMRYGELLGLRYGGGINKIFDLREEVDYYDEWNEPVYKDKKAWAWVLMAAVPTGLYVGEHLYEKYEPSNGQAWVWTTWTAGIGLSGRLAHHIIDKEPESPDWGGDWRTFTEAQNQYQEDYDKWEKRGTIAELVSYPIGMYLGQKLVQNKNYSFGDAVMIMQGWTYGYFNTMMLQSLLFDDGDENMFFFLASAGGLAHMYGYDRWIQDEDYSFGQSMLMLLGSGSGIFFGFGTAIMLDITDKPMLAFGLAGYGAGTYLTRSILNVAPDGSLAENTSTKVSIAPTAIPSFTGSSYTFTPGIGVNISFK